MLGRQAGAARLRPGRRAGPGVARDRRAGRGPQPRASTSSSSTPRAGCTSTTTLMQELRGDPRRGRADRRALRRRRDDGAGRDQERRRVQPPRRRHRRRADQARRRRARRRGALGRGGGRRADRVCRASASGSRTSSRSRPTAWCRGCSAWATCCRSSSGPSRRSTRTRPRGSSRSCASDDFTLEDFLAQLKTLRKMGPLEQVLGMLPGHGQPEAARRRPARRGADGRASRRSSAR